MQKNLETKLISALYIVATPMGNLSDITLRAIEILERVDLILAEDTRHSQKLLHHLNIKKPMVSFHQHNENEKIESIIKELKQGKSLALISDAGTPLISDPGYRLVRLAQDEGFKVIPIPGPCALITALSASGLPTDQFLFAGFLPAKAGERLHALDAFKYDSRTLIFYEAPHRIVDTMQTMKEVFGPEREAVLARELTKTFETIHRGTLSNQLEWLQDENQQKGEIVILLAGFEAKADKDKDTIETKKIQTNAAECLKILLSELSVNQAVRLAKEITGLPKKLLYKHALELKDLN